MKSAVYVTTAMFFGVIGADTQVPDPGSIEIWRWVIQQGGLVTAIALLLYFWRRDMKAAHDKDLHRLQVMETERDVLIDALKENTQAFTKCIDALDHMSSVVEKLADRMRS